MLMRFRRPRSSFSSDSAAAAAEAAAVKEAAAKAKRNMRFETVNLEEECISIGRKNPPSVFVLFSISMRISSRIFVFSIFIIVAAIEVFKRMLMQSRGLMSSVSSAATTAAVAAEVTSSKMHFTKVAVSEDKGKTIERRVIAEMAVRDADAAAAAAVDELEDDWSFTASFSS